MARSRAIHCASYTSNSHQFGIETFILLARSRAIHCASYTSNLNQFGIETRTCAIAAHVRVSAFNRTSLELKRPRLFRNRTFNRTSLELKRPRLFRNRTFNHTSLELKRAHVPLLHMCAFRTFAHVIPFLKTKISL